MSLILLSLFAASRLQLSSQLESIDAPYFRYFTPAEAPHCFGIVESKYHEEGSEVTLVEFMPGLRKGEEITLGTEKWPLFVGANGQITYAKKRGELAVRAWPYKTSSTDESITLDGDKAHIELSGDPAWIGVASTLDGSEVASIRFGVDSPTLTVFERGKRSDHVLTGPNIDPTFSTVRVSVFRKTAALHSFRGFPIRRQFPQTCQ